jgi:ABC-2 type transport system permease protein
MKVLDIALKDLLRSFRSAFALVFMFVIPLLTVGLFYFAFGGMGGDEEGFQLPTTRVLVVNLDEPQSQSGGFSAGQMLVDLLRSEDLAELLEVKEARDAASARASVDNQEAAVAVIIPAGFTAATSDPAGEAIVELYQDPTLTLGPGIVKTVVGGVIDGFAGSAIAVGVVEDQLKEQGMTVDEATRTLVVRPRQRISHEYGAWAQRATGADQQGEANPLLDVRSPADTGGGNTDRLPQQILSLTMAGMMIFYAFFTGANSSESILREEEEGTLPRIFTTPTPRSAILGGKFLAVFATILVQVVVLELVAALVFKIAWGALPALAFATLGLVVLASSFGIFLTSLLKNTKQTGIIFGGVMTVTGMLGVSSMFTAATPGASQATKAAEGISLLVPQGWAMRTWRLIMDGGSAGDVLPTVAVMLVLGIALFVLGALKFRKRFA